MLLVDRDTGYYVITLAELDTKAALRKFVLLADAVFCRLWLY